MNHKNVSRDIALGLRELQERIRKAQIPSSKIDESLNLATWNIREFGKEKRSKAAVHLIAEILGQFDLIAIAELRDNLKDLGRVMAILGPYWRAVYSDYLEDPGGNRERFAYLYDERAVTFTGLASEADPPRKKNARTGEYESLITWWRNPYIGSFRSSSLDFIVVTAHIRWGDDPAARSKELSMLADWVDRRVKDKSWEDKDIIVVGDFNIPSLDDSLYKAVTAKGLRAPTPLLRTDIGTDLEKVKRYDQILHYPKFTKSFSNNGGILDFYDGDYAKLFPGMTLSKQEFTYQVSDHLPLWVQLNTDVETERLEQIINLPVRH